MKRAAILLFMFCLLLGSCVPEPAMRPELDIPVLPEIGSYQKGPAQKRMYPEFTDSVPPREDYGQLIPYIGLQLTETLGTDSIQRWQDRYRFGLCTAEGVIVTDPVYSAIERYGDTYLLRIRPIASDWREVSPSPEDPEGLEILIDYEDDDYCTFAVCRCDGSFYRELPRYPDKVTLSPRGDRLISGERTEGYGMRYRLCTLEGDPLTEWYERIQPAGDSGLYIAWNPESVDETWVALLDSSGAVVFRDSLVCDIQYADGVFLLKTGTGFQTMDTALHKRYGAARKLSEYNRMIGPCYTESDSEYVPLAEGIPALRQRPAWTGEHYFLYDDDAGYQVYDREMRLLRTIPGWGGFHSYGSRYASAQDSYYDDELEERFYYETVCDLVTGEMYRSDIKVYGFCTYRGADALIEEKDGGVYNLLDGTRMFSGSLIRIWDTPNGNYFAVLDREKLLTLDPDGNVLTSFLANLD